MVHRTLSLLIVISLIMTGNLFAQVDTTIISGTILDQNREPLVGVTVQLDNTNIGTSSNRNGKFNITDVKAGTYLLKISAIGYQTYEQEVTISDGERLLLDIILKEDVIGLNQVVVTAPSNSALIEQTSFAVNSIETQTVGNITSDVHQVLNASSGIRIRESGGVGSNYDLSLNGLSGRQIRIFLDGIPIDQLGSGYNLNNISINLVKRVDVYKGVVPIKLGADALGGAINIITDRQSTSYLDASYSLGSFNTHRGALNSRYRFEGSGLTVGLSGYLNYSDNNYEMNDMTVFVDGENRQLDITRFHDSYESAQLTADAGFTELPWADELMARYSYSQINQDIQNGVYGTPVGEAVEEEENTSYALRYRKSELLNEKLDLNLFGLYNSVNSTSIDTSSNRYNWNGEIIRTENNNLGELVREKTIFKYDQSQYLFRLNADYEIANEFRVSVNQLYSDISRQGENRLNTDNDELFRSPNTLQKSVTGLSLNSNFWNDRLETVAALKFYHFDMLTKNAVEYEAGDFLIEDIETSQQNIGFSFSGRYYIIPQLFAKASFEKGYRLPQPREIFGDGLRILANPELKPETSNNLNLGLSHTYTFSGSSIKNTVNLFQRDVNDYIFHQQDGVFSSYQNVLNVLVQGLEWDGSYQHRDKLSVSANLTWQQVLNNQKYISGTKTKSRVYGDQMPNTPYFFANIRTSYKAHNLFPAVTVSFYHAANFVHEFYLNYPSVSIQRTKNVIPHQFLNHAGVTVSSHGGRINVSLESKNIFDSEAYDNFNLQKPGRSFYLKLRYLFR